jgi:hypothetical protein
MPSDNDFVKFTEVRESAAFSPAHPNLPKFRMGFFCSLKNEYVGVRKSGDLGGSLRGLGPVVGLEKQPFNADEKC